MKRKDYKSYDGKIINIAIWDEVENPKAVVQIIHGMGEHIERYAHFAQFLNSKGFIVVGDDHRAHGLTAGSREKMGLTENGGDLFEQTLFDNLDLSKWIGSTYNLPLIVLGHSYGSFLLQRYMQEKTSGVCAYVVMGSAYMKGGTMPLARFLALFGKDDKEGKIFHKMTFGAYDKKIKQGASAWLSREPSVAQKYNDDPFCNKVMSYAFYRAMFRGISNIYKKQNIIAANKQVPVLIISGGEDAVGGYGKLSKKLHQKFVEWGFSNVDFRLYEGARHEILNETNKQEVYQDLVDFFQKALNLQPQVQIEE